MATVTLFHGSERIVETPDIRLGNPHNDYGRGFYCTKDIEMAKEWACKKGANGFVSCYELDTENLQILDLMDGKHTILNWMALLLQNRTFSIKNEIAADARDYLIEHYAVDTAGVDAVSGYRADDSYFSFAEAFVENGLPLRRLNRALRLGKLGEQTALISSKAFERLSFREAVPVDKTVYYPKFIARDTEARNTYRSEIRGGRSYRDDIFVLDILREEMQNDDPRIQRILSE